MNLYDRMIDANLNRASEGLRACEDLARFRFQNKDLAGRLKELRHRVRSIPAGLEERCLRARDSAGDPGKALSEELNLDGRKNEKDFLAANFKRAQEALRTAEETLKLTEYAAFSREMERCRFACYELEQDFSFLLDGKKAILNDMGVYCITAEEYSNGRTNLEVAEEMLKAGAKVIQYREKDKKMGKQYEECVKLREMTQKAGALLLINDHVDLALAVDADGVHVGQDDMPVEQVRALLGSDKIIGLSTHSPEQAQDALRRGVDYIGVGPIFKTYTKKDVCDPVGISYLEYTSQNIPLPQVAIGGIKEANAAQVAAAGASCICAVTEITGAENIQAKIKALQAILKEAKQ